MKKAWIGETPFTKERTKKVLKCYFDQTFVYAEMVKTYFRTRHSHNLILKPTQHKSLFYYTI